MPQTFESHGWSSPPGARMIDYRAVVTRGFPEWKATLTGGGIPEPGQVLTSLSYVRLQGDVSDWLEWNEWGELNGWVRDPDTYHGRRKEDDTEDGCGEGWSVTYDYRWPQEVNYALQRYRAARDAIDETGTTTEVTISAIGEPLCTVAEELQAGAADVAALVFLAVEQVEQIIMEYRTQADFLARGRTLEDWRAWREYRDQRKATKKSRADCPAASLDEN